MKQFIPFFLSLFSFLGKAIVAPFKVLPPVAHFDGARAMFYHDQAAKLSHYDEDYDADAMYEDYDEAFENYKRRGKDQDKAARLALAKVTSKYGEKAKKLMQRPAQMGNPDSGNSSAQFNIVVTRVSANLAGIALPVPLFAYIHYVTAYAQLVNQYLPSGISISGIQSSTSAVTISYTNGIVTDTVTITCTEVSYLTFLAASLVDLMTLSKVRYSISDATQTDQYSQVFAAVRKDLFGDSKQKTISAAQFKNPQQFQQGIVDLDVTLPLDKESGLVVGIKAIAGFSFTLSAFVRRYNKYDSRLIA